MTVKEGFIIAFKVIGFMFKVLGYTLKGLGYTLKYAIFAVIFTGGGIIGLAILSTIPIGIYGFIHYFVAY